MRLAVITPTRNRPLGIQLLTNMVERQSRAPDLWVIVDSGEEQTPLPDKLPNGGDVIRLLNPHPVSVTGPQSLLDNVCMGLEECRRAEVEAIAIMEDDDWYDPNYLLTATRFLRRSALYGETNSLYYNVRTRRHSMMGNYSHASLCSTAWNEEKAAGIVDDAIGACRTGPRSMFLDLAIWKTAHEAEVDTTLRSPNPRQVLSIKGIPGTIGIGAGHHSELKGFDPDGALLKDLVGEDDALRYLAMYQHAQPGQDYGR